MGREPRNRAERREAMRKARRVAGAALAAGTAAFGTGAAIIGTATTSAATPNWLVTKTADTNDGTCDSDCSLREAIANAAGGDTISFAPSVTGTITLNAALYGELKVNQGITITGPGASTLAVSGNNLTRVFYLSNSTADVVITGLTIKDGDTSGDGAGIQARAVNSLTLTNTVVTGNHAGADGGGVSLYRVNTLDVTSSTISGNTASEQGGGLYAYNFANTTSTISGSVISGNTADASGGGVALYGVTHLDVTNTTVSGNTSHSNGGGIALYDTDNNAGGLTVLDSTISGNTADSKGGGLYVTHLNSGGVQVQNSTISGNTAASGGGVFQSTGSSTYAVALTQSTVTNNTGGGGVGGNLIAGGAVPAPKAFDHPNRVEPKELHATVGTLAGDELHLVATIVAGNTGAADLDNTAVTVFSDHSLIGTVAGGVTVTDQGGTIFGTNPLLGALASNGGPTKTHALLAGSPAINAGPTTVPTFTGNGFDQRGTGFARVVNGRVDIGAFEAPTVAVTGTPHLTG